MYDSTVPKDYRGRDKMTLVEFIEDVEKCNFRTGHDTGANPNALMVWNILREYAGLQSLDMDDLIRRHAETDGKTFEDMKQDYIDYDNFRKGQRNA